VKSSNLWRIIWIVGIYAILLIILYLVVTYKVKWEHKDLNTYVYFYDCGRELCSSTREIDDYYSKFLCSNNECPYIDTIIGNNLILRTDKNNSIIYNYFDGEVFNNKYSDYRYIGRDMYVVRDSNDKYGIIDNKGNIIVEVNHDYIDNYNKEIISYVKNGLYGIKSIKDNLNIDIKPRYEDVVLINEKIFAVKEDKFYRFYSYNDLNNGDSNNYNYIYCYEDTVFVIKDKKIDILNTNLKSTLLMKIDTFYEYSIGQERDSLDIYSDGDFIYFKVFISEDTYHEYKYDINNQKLNKY